jgi:endonuclease YncB( thermonuclease family)
MFRTATTFFLLVYWTVASVSFAADVSYPAKVISITDGDTLKVLNKNQQVKIRLAEIDCPERGQPWGNKAKQALSGYTFQKTVTIDPVTKDRYGRTVATVIVEGENVNKMMVQQGHCWVYRRYVQDPEFFDLENEARTGKRGLWSLLETERVPPWEWRKLNK